VRVEKVAPRPRCLFRKWRQQGRQWWWPRSRAVYGVRFKSYDWVLSALRIILWMQPYFVRSKMGHRGTGAPTPQRQDSQAPISERAVRRMFREPVALLTIKPANSNPVVDATRGGIGHVISGSWPKSRCGPIRPDDGSAMTQTRIDVPKIVFECRWRNEMEQAVWGFLGLKVWTNIGSDLCAGE
jgi:hypothetical protein